MLLFGLPYVLWLISFRLHQEHRERADSLKPKRLRFRRFDRKEPSNGVYQIYNSDTNEYFLIYWIKGKRKAYLMERSDEEYDGFITHYSELPKVKA